jgi:Leucine-rich repeat (LRR) protein
MNLFLTSYYKYHEYYLVDYWTQSSCLSSFLFLLASTHQLTLLFNSYFYSSFSPVFSLPHSHLFSELLLIFALPRLNTTQHNTTLNHTETLDISKNRLESVPDLSNMRALKMLNASFNKITAMPLLPSRGKLDRVYFGENALKELDMDSLLHSANSITELLVQGNQLTQCPDRIYLLNCLKILDMSNNCLSNLPPALGYMPTLSKILMEGNAIRTIRRPLLSSPQAEDLKVFLRTRGPPPTEQSVRVRTHPPSQSPSHHPFTPSLPPSLPLPSILITLPPITSSIAH